MGALIVWGVLACFTALKLPGASYLFAWPLLAVTIAAVVEMVWRDSAGAYAARRVVTKNRSHSASLNVIAFSASSC